MMFDFTLKSYNSLIKAFQSVGYCFQSFDLYLTHPEKKTVILRHDIDANPEKAHEFAIIDSDLGIKSTFYFRATMMESGYEQIKQVAGLGHEVGYHYEDLTSSHGNHLMAYECFKNNLTKFRDLYPVTTICMDGKPLSKYNNLDLWKHYDYKQLNLIGEPFLDVDFKKVLYLTDTGRGWNLTKYSVRDKVHDQFHYINKTTKQLIADINNGILPDRIMINIHPQRWHNKPIPWIRELILQRTKNMAKWILIRFRNDH